VGANKRRAKDDFPRALKQEVHDAQNGQCARPGCNEDIHSIHHRKHNDPYNRGRYPNFVQSIFNAVGLCKDCHDTKKYLWDITDQVAQSFEDYLAKLKEAGMVEKLLYVIKQLRERIKAMEEKVKAANDRWRSAVRRVKK